MEKTKGSKVFAAAMRAVEARPARMAEYFDRIHEAAKLGVAEAQEQLGSWYLEGYSGTDTRLRRNRKRGRRLLELAAQKGERIAAGRLGCFYDIGEGGKRSETLAIKYYLRAVRLGDAVSARNLALLYRDRGNRRLQRAWLLRALDMGEEQAAFDLGRLLLETRTTRTPWGKRARRELHRIARDSSPDNAQEAESILLDLKSSRSPERG